MKGSGFEKRGVHCLLGKVVFALVMLLTLPWAASEALALALAPDNLLIVFNRKVPASQAVADYYAGKRQVPPANLVGVEVTTSEKMPRQDFEEHLLPPVRAAAVRLKAQGKTPALLLVYGIPLLVRGPEETESDQALKAVAAAKATEYRDLVGQLLRELDQLTQAPESLGKSSRWLSYPPSRLLTLAEESFNRGLEFLRKKSWREEEEPARVKVLSLLLRLGGTSPEAKALAAKLAKEDVQERQLSPKQELLSLDAVMRLDLELQAFSGILPETALETAATVRFTKGVMGEWQFWENLHSLQQKPEKSAAVDSELTLALRDGYQTAKWLPNPFHSRYDSLPLIKEVRQKTLMVGRLDGPTPEIAKRLVDDALETEKTGLKGTLYIDARGLKGESSYGNYTWYDQHLVSLYELVKKSSSLKVVLDQNRNLFPPGSCPDAALYVGWYSLGNYVASCKWNRGAVGYHVASAEASTLKQKGSNVWCKRLLEEGVAATLGPVAEPYLVSFPLPDEFFPLLMTGELPLLEVYFRTLPHVSWRQILIGDPLYIPFKNNPAILPPQQ